MLQSVTSLCLVSKMKPLLFGFNVITDLFLFSHGLHISGRRRCSDIRQQSKGRDCKPGRPCGLTMVSMTSFNCYNTNYISYVTKML